MKRITLKYKGPDCKGSGAWLTDVLKVAMALYFPFLFKVVDSEGFELEY